MALTRLETPAIKDLAVTTEKLASDAVTSAKIAPDTITLSDVNTEVEETGIAYSIVFGG
ncbi:MAG: hypothetical protein ACOVLB_07390 [Candidatus Nanopelagicus sp.]|jgi:hypothetical protein